MASFESFRRGVCGKRGGKPHSGSRPENSWTRRQCCRTVGHELKVVDEAAMLSHSGSRTENWWTRRQCCRTVGHELKVGGQDGNVVAQWVTN